MNAEPTFCTPKHPFFHLNSKRRKVWSNACDLTTNDYIKVPRDSSLAKLPQYSGVDIGSGYNRTTKHFTKYVKASYLSQFFPVPEFWWVVGRFLGDGWVTYRRKKSSSRRPGGTSAKGVIICCAKDEVAEITSVLDSLGWTYKTKARRTVSRISLCGTKEYGAKSELVDFFKQFGHFCHGKFIPQFCFDLPTDLKEALVDGYLSADGHIFESKYGSGKFRASSVSRPLILGVVRLINDSKAICVGRIKTLAAGTWSIEGRSGKTMEKCHFDATYDGVGSPLGYTVDEKGDMWVRVRGITSEDYDGHVYNMHVEEDESYTANGLASHNCKSFSTAGAKDKGWGHVSHYSEGVHQRTDDLFFEYVRMVKGLQPKVFVAENVKGLVEGTSKGYFLEILAALKACGYVVKARVLNAAYLGVPQARERLIIVGVRNDIAKMGFMPTHPQPLDHTITVRDVLPHIRRLKSKRKDLLTYVPSDIPSPTIVASDGTNSETAAFSSGGFIEDSEGNRRKYTIPELKKIFTFPEDFKLPGKFEQQWERLGRSAPPMMMYHVGAAVVRDILRPYYKKLGVQK